jgi:branched-subunit amino acid ABC-type transport system permease component
MIWMTWRQFRTPALATGALLLVLVGSLALTWAEVTQLAARTGYTGCRGDACRPAGEAFLQALQPGWASEFHIAAIAALYLLPALVGIFWGAPRDRETCPKWLQKQNLSLQVVSVPGSRFWSLQWREFGVLFALTAVLSLFSLWWIRRRLV